MVQSLERITLEVLLISIHQQPTLGKLPEHLALQLFDSVLASGKLTPQVLKLFLDTQHVTIIDRITGLDLQMPPPVIQAGRGTWLGENSRLF